MSGETDLRKLLSGLMPALSPDEFVFVSVPDADVPFSSLRKVKGMFREAEGVTLICERREANEQGFCYSGVFRLITCEVHSSLDAVGMTAAMAAALTKAGISANVVAAYYHDHIFIPCDRAAEAVAVLKALGNA
mgnify:CR=1 FL=1